MRRNIVEVALKEKILPCDLAAQEALCAFQGLVVNGISGGQQICLYLLQRSLSG
jgi:hypothetical protein